MRIAIISDIHGNFDALTALPRDYDELWVLGDLVNYGPEPKAVIEFVRENAAIVLGGNHDHAVGHHEDPMCAPPYKPMAEATMAFTEEVLLPEEKSYLASLPTTLEHAVGATKFFLCHATPSDPLFGYRPKESAEWEKDLVSCGADVLLAGHTHVPFQRSTNRGVVANPGSLGQPKTGDTAACYAIWEDGRLELRVCQYPVERTVLKIKALQLPEDVANQLCTVLRTGGSLVAIRPKWTGWWVWTAPAD
jgi:putative phosphoesterase